MHIVRSLPVDLQAPSPMREDFPTNRNLARQKIAALSADRFKVLCGDVYHELCRRHPEMEEKLQVNSSKCSCLSPLADDSRLHCVGSQLDGDTVIVYSDDLIKL